jgi:hypothetical protein
MSADDPLLHYRGRLGRYARALGSAGAQAAPAAPEPKEAPAADEQGGHSAHIAMRRQVMDILDRSDIDAQEKRRILANMSCPCCSGSGIGMVLDLKGLATD